MLINAFLVEDKADIRRALVDAIEEMAPLKFVGHAADELGAREWLSANDSNWDIAIVDLFLEAGTGFGVLRDCQARLPRQKVVVLTSYNQQNVLDRCRELGVDEIFDKSTDVEKLVTYCKAHAYELAGKLPLQIAAHAPPPMPSAIAPPAPDNGRATPLFTQNSRV
ncbi:MAG: response regulator transcription factor [Comamonadaceae bacterium]|nr:MAG: response regulator transcription factor [Comamonadaceae bacterium]